MKATLSISETVADAIKNWWYPLKSDVAIHLQEHVGCNKSRPLIAVLKGVVLQYHFRRDFSLNETGSLRYCSVATFSGELTAESSSLA